MLEGRKGFDILTGDGGADSFVFDGAVGRLGHDRIVDFEQGEDVLLFEDMRLTSTRMIGGFDDLDTNGDGVINNDDTSAISFGGDTYLMMHSAIVELLDVTDLTANDFVFA
ncbi:MAG: hypothetical protein AAGC86_07775 [Pseudomonadota bacterium]